MNSLFFKSSKGLIKNSSVDLDTRMDLVLKEQRHQRYDLKVINDKLDKLLVDKHLQMQVDEYFEDNKPPETGDLD